MKISMFKQDHQVQVQQKIKARAGSKLYSYIYICARSYSLDMYYLMLLLISFSFLAFLAFTQFHKTLIVLVLDLQYLYYLSDFRKVRKNVRNTIIQTSHIIGKLQHICYRKFYFFLTQILFSYPYNLLHVSYAVQWLTLFPTNSRTWVQFPTVGDSFVHLFFLSIRAGVEYLS